jgi:hypothetical protein
MKKQSYDIYSIFQIIIIILVILSIIFIIYINFFTKYQKTITISKLDYYRGGKKGLNLVTDTNGNVYVISNSLLQGFFTGPELYSSLKEGKTYNIKGFGIRIPIISNYPHITSAIENKITSAIEK